MKLMAEIMYLICFTLLSFYSLNYNLKVLNFLEQDRILLNDTENISFNNRDSTQKDINYSIPLKGANTDNCTQYSTDFSCLHFYGCMWIKYPGKCVFFENTGYNQVYKVTLPTNFTKVIINLYDYQYSITNYTFFINYATKEFHWSYDSYQRMSPRYDLCLTEYIRLNYVKGNLNNILDRAMPSYAHCSWVIYSSYDPTYYTYQMPIKFSLRRQSQGIDNVRICNVRIPSKATFNSRPCDLDGCYSYHDWVFENSSFDCGIDNTSYIKKGIVKNVSEVEEFVYLKVIDYEYLGPPYQNSFSFSIKNIDPNTEDMSKYFVDLNNNLNSMIENSKIQTNLIANLSNSTYQISKEIHNIINKTTNVKTFKDSTLILENDSNEVKVLTSNTHPLNQENDISHQNNDSVGIN